jgi:pantoate kinase
VKNSPRGRLLRIELERDVEVCVWVPCHITCFFEIREHDNPLETGSRGAGFNLDVGIRTIVRLRRSRDVEVSGGNDVSRDVVERMLRGLDVRARAELEHDEPVPMGVGYGVSGATALGAAMATSVALGNVMTLSQAGAVAHVVEVEHMTGLGDVIAQMHGGVEVRVREGAPGVGVVDKLLHEPDLRLITAVLRKIPTREMLTEKREEINKYGRLALASLLKRPSIEALMRGAKAFAEGVGFMDEDVKRVAEEVVERGALGASVKKGVFYALTKEELVEELSRLVKERLRGARLVVCGIYNGGPRVVYVKRL